MTTATATEEQLHPLNPLTYQVKFAKTELSTLIAELRKAETRRRQLIVQGAVKPLEEEELKTVEHNIGTLRLKIDRIEVKIEGLEEDLPRVDAETRTAVENLEAAKKRMPEVLAELTRIDAETEVLCESQAVRDLVVMVKKRTELVEELTDTIPMKIQDSESYLHLAPSRREEFPQAPKRPEKIRNLVEILK